MAQNVSMETFNEIQVRGRVRVRVRIRVRVSSDQYDPCVLAIIYAATPGVAPPL